jgi:hypothetical protein
MVFHANYRYFPTMMNHRFLLLIFLCGLPGFAQAQVNLTPEARLQLDHLEALEEVEKQRKEGLLALNDNYQKKLYQLREHLADDERLVAVLAEIGRLDAAKPKIRVVDEDPELMKQFRAIYLREREKIHLETEIERDKLARINRQEQSALAGRSAASGQPATPPDLPTGTGASSTVLDSAGSVDREQAITRTSQASGERLQREMLEVEGFLPPAPAQLLDGESLVVRVRYVRVMGSRARISVHPLSASAPDIFISSGKTVFGLGSGVIDLEIRAKAPAQINRLYLEVRDAVTDKLLMSNTVDTSVVWVKP